MIQTISKLMILVLFSIPAFAGECVLTVTREACPGKDDAAYKPYGGQKTKPMNKSASDEAACRKAVEQECKIVRKGVLKSKSIKATFDGKDLDGGKDQCAGHKDYDRC